MIEHQQHPNARSTFLTTLSLPSSCFLSDVCVMPVDESGCLQGGREQFLAGIAETCLEAGSAIVTDEALPSHASAALAIPIHRGGEIVSVVVIASRAPSEEVDDPIGVFEIWEPLGVYEEVALRAGFYGKMERFQNVSSFVRFEKGNGLPGQVWDRRCGVIHDDLSNHPGFLRAAGASADLLRTAVGLPIAPDEFAASVVLISSVSTPIARGMEVWQVCPDTCEFELASAAYHELGDSYGLPVGTRRTSETVPFARVMQSQQAVVTNDPQELLGGRDPDAATPGPASGLAIPFFEGQTLTSFTLLMF